MNTAMIFAILGIAETKEEEAIRNAYREKLTAHNPEEDQEGFRRLREAYEQALSYAREPDKEEREEEDNTPLGQWMKQVKEVYFHLSKRLDNHQWETLLKNDICLDLEYGDEAKQRLFQFLAMGHYQLNSSTYQLLDNFFHIRQEADAFKELLPVGFVDYMLHRIADTEGMNNFPYQWIEGEDTADYDQFQESLYELENLVGEKKTEEAEQLVTAMEQLKIDHPYYRLAKAQLRVLHGDKTAADTARELQKNYPANLKIQILSAEILWACDMREDAATIFNKVSENFGTYYLSEKYLALYDREQGDLASAIRHCLTALNYAEDDELKNMRTELDNEFITQCTDALAAGTLTTEMASQLCTSFIRTNRNEEGIDFIKSHPEYAAEMKHTHKYLSVLFYQADKARESEEECRLWQETVAAGIADADTEEDLANFRQDMSMAYCFHGRALWTLAEQTEQEVLAPSAEAVVPNRQMDEQTALLASQAEQAFEKALEYAPNQINIYQDLLDLLIFEDAYEKAIQLADKILALDEAWFPALVQKQKACYELGQAQEVVDLFYEAKELCQEFPDIYELAAWVFIEYGQFHDAEGIFTQAKEAEAESPGLDLAAIRYRRLQCRCDTDFFDALRDATALLEKFQEKNVENKYLAGLYCEMAIIEDCQYYEEFIHMGKAEEYIQKAIDLRRGERFNHYSDYYYTYGCILKNAEKYQEALDAFTTFTLGLQVDENTAMNMAFCLDKLGQWENAISLYEYVLTLNPENETANSKIVTIYMREGNDRDSIPLTRKALPYADIQIKLEPHIPRHYWTRGVLYKRLGIWDKAMEDADQAIHMKKNYALAQNLKGLLLHFMGKYAQALFYFKKAMANLENPTKHGNGLAVCSNASKTCAKTGNFAQQEEWLRRGIEVLDGSDQAWCYESLASSYESQGRFDEALSLLQEAYGEGVMTEALYMEYCLGIEISQCPNRELPLIQLLEQKALETAKRLDSIELWEIVSDIQYYYLPDLEKALATKKMIMERVHKENDWWEHIPKLIERMRIYWELGNPKAIDELGKLYLQTIEEHFCFSTEEFPPIEQYLSHPYTGYLNTCNMVSYWVCTGQMDKAAEGIAQLQSRNVCPQCTECRCTEMLEALAVYSEACGDLEKAYQYYQECLTVSPYSRLAHYEIRRLSQKL